jgi:xanthine dehydrogenase small subunit
MTELWLNDRHILSSLPKGMPLVDFIRREEGLPGTKVGCREGDCGACVVLEGRLLNGKVEYQAITACLATLGRAHGRHIVTVEALAGAGLSPVQQAICDHAATQCGFCTPGIVMSLTAFCLSRRPATAESAVEALDGNLCRCTGYQSLKAVAASLASNLPPLPEDRPVPWLIRQGYLPAWFAGMEERLAALSPLATTDGPLLAGGTDRMVQAPDEILARAPHLLPPDPDWNAIRLEEGDFVIGAGATSTEIIEHEALRACFSHLPEYGRLIASTPIRNMGTLGGNLANASPIADWAIFFLALDAALVLKGPKGERRLPLSSFFMGYKQLDLKSGERIAALRFPRPPGEHFFHFEKVCKRQHLDIASVNSAAFLVMDGVKIATARFSAGGVSPVPLFLKETSRFLEGKVPDEAVLTRAQTIAQQEIAPISDIRGSAAYKRLLLRQLIFAHFMSFSPGLISEHTIRQYEKP